MTSRKELRKLILMIVKTMRSHNCHRRMRNALMEVYEELCR